MADRKRLGRLHKSLSCVRVQYSFRHFLSLAVGKGNRGINPLRLR